MAVSDWSTTPSANSTIDGQNIAEGCPAGNINGAIRSIMASVRVMYNAIPNTNDFLKADASLHVQGPLKRAYAGGFLFNNSGDGGRVYVQPLGGPMPAMQDGDWLAEF